MYFARDMNAVLGMSDDYCAQYDECTFVGHNKILVAVLDSFLTSSPILHAMNIG